MKSLSRKGQLQLGAHKVAALFLTVWRIAELCVYQYLGLTASPWQILD